MDNTRLATLYKMKVGLDSSKTEVNGHSLRTVIGKDHTVHLLNTDVELRTQIQWALMCPLHGLHSGVSICACGFLVPTSRNVPSDLFVLEHST